MVLKAFLGGEHVFVLMLAGFGKHLVKHRVAGQLATGWSLMHQLEVSALVTWLNWK